LVHGAPDNYQVQQKSTTFRLDDMAESVIRLKGLMSIDRLGEVITFEDYSNGFGQGSISVNGAGSSYNIDSVYFMSNGFSLHLIAGSDGITNAHHTLELPYHVLSKFGLECWFYPHQTPNYIWFGLDVYDSINRHYGLIEIDILNNILRLYLSPGEYVDVDTNFKVTSGYYLWYPIKLVIDPINDKYVKIVTHEQTYNINSYSLYTQANIAVPYISADCGIKGNDGDNDDMYVDRIIITQNEP